MLRATGSRSLPALVLLGLFLALVVAAPSRPAGPAGGGRCSRFASTTGNDTNPGTSQAPYRTISALMTHLAAGQTGCLVRGSTFNETVVIQTGGRPGAPLTLMTGPGQGPLATIVGAITDVQQATDVRLYQLRLRGPSGQAQPLLTIEGSRSALLNSDVSGAATAASHSQSCLLINGATDVVVDANTIHDCGRATGAGSAAIFVGSSNRATITDNFVFGTTGDAIALGPGAKRSVVSHNLIFNNGSGVWFSGTSTAPNGSNHVTTNIIAFSQQYAVHSDYPGQTSVRTANLVTSNCIWQGQISITPPGAFLTAHNISADPRLVSPATSTAIRPGPCFDKRPVHLYEDVALTGGAHPVLELPMLGVFYVSSAGSIYNLHPGARVDVICVSGCTGSEHLVAGRSGVVKTKLLPAAVAAGKPAKLRLVETRTGYIGRWKLAVVGPGRLSTLPSPTTAYCLPPKKQSC